MMEAAERLYGPYRWDRYDILVLPPSFPFGGMENPRLTFATPTVLAGDKSLVSLIAHELAHSWSGNLVTNATWSDFWLNEGFTTYIERRIVEEVYGAETAGMEAVLGRQDLEDEIARLEDRDEILHIDLVGARPGRGRHAPALREGRALPALARGALRAGALRPRSCADTSTTSRFRASRPRTSSRTCASTCSPGTAAGRDSVPLAEWIERPGLPAAAPRPTSEALRRVAAAAQDWVGGNTAPGLKGFPAWNTHERLQFLRQLPSPLPPHRLAVLDDAFALTGSRNAEIASQWLLMSLRSGLRPDRRPARGVPRRDRPAQVHQAALRGARQDRYGPEPGPGHLPEGAAGLPSHRGGHGGPHRGLAGMSAARPGEQHVESACPLDCPDACSLDITLSDGRVVAVGGSEKNPVTRGYICSKVRRYPEHLYGQTRIPHPGIREGRKGEGRFRRASWDEALDLVAAQDAGRSRHARRGGDPSAVLRRFQRLSLPGHDGRAALLPPRRVAPAADGLRRPVEQRGHGALRKDGGSRLPGLRPRQAHRRLGHEPVGLGNPPRPVHPGSAEARRPPRRRGSAADAAGGARGPASADSSGDGPCRWRSRSSAGCSRRAGPTAPSSRRTRTAPTSSRGAPSPGRSSARRARRACRRPTSRRSPDSTRTFRRRRCAAAGDPSAAATGVRRPRRSWPSRRWPASSACAAAATRSPTRRPGARSNGMAAAKAEEPRTRAINMNRVGAALAEKGSASIDLLFVYNDNPLMTLPEQERVRAGLEREDLFTVVFDPVMTDTARYADVVLPATTFLERTEISRGYGAFVMQEAHAVIPPVGEARPNHEVFADLCRRLGLARPGDPRPRRRSPPRSLEAAGAARSCGRASTESRIAFLEAGDRPRAVRGRVSEHAGRQDPPRARGPRPRGAARALRLPAGARRQPLPAGPDLPVERPHDQLDPGRAAPRARSGRDASGRRGAARHPRRGPRARVQCARIGALLRARGLRHAHRAWCILPKGIWSHNTESGTTANALSPDTLTDLGGGACFNDARVDIEPAGTA